ncbi:MAG: tetratricopeptide repeat protein [Planctomycetaceae bacterium]|nr:tetratricopeptide repeat protein [Planctomycetaceae bacterium]
MSTSQTAAPAASNASAPDFSGALNLGAIRADVIGKSVKGPHNWPLVFVALGAVALVFGWIGFQEKGEPEQSAGPLYRPTVAVTAPKKVAQSQPASAPQELPTGLSWAAAQRYFAAGDYERALMQYQQLLMVSSERPGPGPMAGLFRIRIADCMLKKGDTAEYRRILTEACQGPSPAVNCLANYRLAMLDFDQEMWMQARMRAYRAIASSAALADATEINAQCDLLVARCLTQQVLKVASIDAIVPHSPLPMVDTLSGAKEDDLAARVLNGAHTVTAAALGPRFTRLDDSDAMVRWQGVCLAAPVEQSLNRLGHAVGCDVRWADVTAAVRGRGVTVMTPPLTQQRMFETLAGAAGLLAHFDGKETTLHDPTAYESAAEARHLLLAEAAAAWRRLFLRDSASARLAEGHYALGIISECTSDWSAAVTEYRLTARQFLQSASAPQALLRSAKVCLKMKDYAGAEEDLTSLLDTYPQAGGMDEVFLSLGNANLESGRQDEALRFFKKVYYLDRSVETKMAAAVGAGDTCFRWGDHEQAIAWLGRYVSLATALPKSQIAPIHLMIARSNLSLDKLSQARRSLRLCLASNPQAKVEIEALIDLARVEGRCERYAQAVVLCDRAQSRVSGDDRLAGQIVLLRAQLQRHMGLTEDATIDLRRRLQNTTDAGEATRLTLELAACYRLGGQIQDAHALLLDLLTRVKPGPAAHRAQCELAELSLELGKNRQAALLSGELLKITPDVQLRARATQVLVAAQVSDKDFNTAVSTMAASAAAGGSKR